MSASQTASLASGRSQPNPPDIRRRSTRRRIRAGETATPRRNASRGSGLAFPDATARARLHCDSENASSPPIPVRSEPPAAASRSGAWKCAFGGQRSPCRAQCGRCDGADEIQLVRVVDPQPVVEAERADDLLLPFPLVGLLRLGEPVRRRDGER